MNIYTHTHISQCLYPVIQYLTHRLFLYLGYCKECGNEHGDADLFEIVCLFSSDKYPDVDLLDHMIFCSFLSNFHRGFPWWLPSFRSHQQCTRVPFSPHCHQDPSYSLLRSHFLNRATLPYFIL